MEKDKQIETIVKIVKANLAYLNNKEYSNKIAFLLLKKDIETQGKIKTISTIYNIIDKSIKYGNYKRALRYSCILKRAVISICEDTKIIL